MHSNGTLPLPLSLDARCVYTLKGPFTPAIYYATVIANANAITIAIIFYGVSRNHNFNRKNECRIHF